MNPFFIAIFTFLCLTTASFTAMFVSPKLSAKYNNDETSAIIRHIASVFVVITSLIFGLLINSAKNTYESINKDMHGFSTDIILLDNTLKSYGPEAMPSREALLSYVEQAITYRIRMADILNNRADIAGQKLEAVGDALSAIVPTNAHDELILAETLKQYHQVVEE